MSTVIGSNIFALKALRRLSDASSAVASSSERLASGQRITRASDDAAGLAIASDLSTRQRVFTQGIRNINDGISALSIADGALESLTQIVTRQQELAEQAANGVYNNKQRAALEKEARGSY